MLKYDFHQQMDITENLITFRLILFFTVVFEDFSLLKNSSTIRKSHKKIGNERKRH